MNATSLVPLNSVMTAQKLLVMPNPGNTEILYVPRTVVRAFVDQPRTQFDPAGIASLGESMREHTQLIPALAKRLNPPIGLYQFELIDGERRWQAAQLKNIEGFLIMVVEGEVLPDEQFIRSVIANFFREPLGLMDLAHAIDRFEKMGLTMSQIGKKMGDKSVTWAFQHHSLLRLVPNVQLLLGPPTPENERISFHTALQLVDLDPDDQLRRAVQISKGEMTQKQARHLILRTTMGKGKINKRARSEFHILARFLRNTNNEIELNLDHDEEVFRQVIAAAKPDELKEMLQHLSDLRSGFEILEEEILVASGRKKEKKSKI